MARGKDRGPSPARSNFDGFADPDLRRRSDRRPRLSYAPGGGSGTEGREREREKERERGTEGGEREGERARERERETQRDRVTGREGRKELEFLDSQGSQDERRSFGRTACGRESEGETQEQKERWGEGPRTQSSLQQDDLLVKKRKKGGSTLRRGADERERDKE